MLQETRNFYEMFYHHTRCFEHDLGGNFTSMMKVCNFAVCTNFQKLCKNVNWAMQTFKIWFLKNIVWFLVLWIEYTDNETKLVLLY